MKNVDGIQVWLRKPDSPSGRANYHDSPDPEQAQADRAKDIGYQSGVVDARPGDSFEVLLNVHNKFDIRGADGIYVAVANGETGLAGHPPEFQDDAHVFYIDAHTLRTVRSHPLGRRPGFYTIIMYEPSPRVILSATQQEITGNGPAPMATGFDQPLLFPSTNRVSVLVTRVLNPHGAPAGDPSALGSTISQTVKNEYWPKVFPHGFARPLDGEPGSPYIFNFRCGDTRRRSAVANSSSLRRNEPSSLLQRPSFVLQDIRPTDHAVQPSMSARNAAAGIDGFDQPAQPMLHDIPRYVGPDLGSYGITTGQQTQTQNTANGMSMFGQAAHASSRHEPPRQTHDLKQQQVAAGRNVSAQSTHGGIRQAGQAMSASSALFLNGFGQTPHAVEPKGKRPREESSTHGPAKKPRTGSKTTTKATQEDDSKLDYDLDIELKRAQILRDHELAKLDIEMKHRLRERMRGLSVSAQPDSDAEPDTVASSSKDAAGTVSSEDETADDVKSKGKKNRRLSEKKTATVEKRNKLEQLAPETEDVAPTKRKERNQATEQVAPARKKLKKSKQVAESAEVSEAEAPRRSRKPKQAAIVPEQPERAGPAKKPRKTKQVAAPSEESEEEAPKKSKNPKKVKRNQA